MFSQNKLKKFSDIIAKKIKNSKININYFSAPYKHLVIDNFFEEELIEECYKNFPDMSDKNWEFANDEDIEIKYRSKWT